MRLHKNKLRRGASAMEFAIVGPAVLLLIFLSCEFVRMSMIRNLAQDAAYEAARHCMVEGATEEEALEKATSVLNMLATRGAIVTINEGEGITTDDEFITVAISISMEDNSFVLPLLYQGRFINTTIQLRVERYQGFYDAS